MLMVFGMSMVPLVELKGAIPFGMAMSLDPWLCWGLSQLGCAMVSLIILLFSRPIMRWMRSTKVFRKLVNWVEGKVHRNVHKVTQKRSLLIGLFIFVAIPLPTTGVWTGSLIASFLDIRFRRAFPAIVLGNLVAGLLIVALGIVAF